MKIMTILGTRPEIIRLSLITKKLDSFCEHLMVHTGQNYDSCLGEVFFQDLEIRKPDYYLEIGGGWFATQVSRLVSSIAHLFDKEKPDRVLILGDTNSGLSAIVAKQMKIPVYHLEAGNRCYNDQTPEEVNRRIIDQCSQVLMPYTERSRSNLLREGFNSQRVFVVGNPINEVICHFGSSILSSSVSNSLDLIKGQYFLVTVHRAENIDNEERLRAIMDSLGRLGEYHNKSVVCSLHPHTKQRIHDFEVVAPNIQFIDPPGFFDFVALEKRAFCVVTDSGTVQEECCILGVPAVVLREATERPETIECGSTILSSPNNLHRSVNIAVKGRKKWMVPKEYLQENVSDTAIKIVLGE